MGEFGRARMLDHLSWEHEAPKLLEAYQSLWGEVKSSEKHGIALVQRG
jgi:hypothetical protein